MGRTLIAAGGKIPWQVSPNMGTGGVTPAMKLKMAA
jgi:hypothetical protein